MSGFKSDAQRKHFFANGGGSGGLGGGGLPSFPDFGSAFIDMEIERQRAEHEKTLVGLTDQQQAREREYFEFQAERIRKHGLE